MTAADKRRARLRYLVLAGVSPLLLLGLWMTFKGFRPAARAAITAPTIQATAATTPAGAA